MSMKTYRPPYMSQSPIAVFQRPRTDSVIIFSVPIGTDVAVLERDIQALDGKSGERYKHPIRLHKILFDSKVGFVNRRWLR